MGRMEQSGMQDRHLKEWSLEPSLRQPAISLEARPAVLWEGVVVSSEIPKLPETWFGLKVK